MSICNKSHGLAMTQRWNERDEEKKKTMGQCRVTHLCDRTEMDYWVGLSIDASLSKLSNGFSISPYSSPTATRSIHFIYSYRRSIHE